MLNSSSFKAKSAVFSTTIGNSSFGVLNRQISKPIQVRILLLSDIKGIFKYNGK